MSFIEYFFRHYSGDFCLTDLVMCVLKIAIYVVVVELKLRCGQSIFSPCLLNKLSKHKSCHGEVGISC